MVDFRVKSHTTAPLDLCSSFTFMQCSGPWSKEKLWFGFLTADTEMQREVAKNCSSFFLCFCVFYGWKKNTVTL